MTNLVTVRLSTNTFKALPVKPGGLFLFTEEIDIPITA